MLETIIEEMNGVLAKGANPSIDSEYSQWLNFLRQIHPDSALLKNQGALSDTDCSKEPRTLAQISEVVECAASEHYPIWRIQPKYVEAIVLEYERGKLKGECRDMGAPEMIEGFNGRVRGAVTDEDNLSLSIWIVAWIFLARWVLEIRSRFLIHSVRDRKDQNDIA